MSRQYTHVQGLLPSVIAMKEKGYTYRQIANQFGMEKEQIEELCSRERRKQRKIEKGYIPQPKGRPRKTPAAQEQLQSNRIVELEMKVELLQNFLSECGRMGEPNIGLLKDSRISIRSGKCASYLKYREADSISGENGQRRSSAANWIRLSSNTKYWRSKLTDTVEYGCG